MGVSGKIKVQFYMSKSASDSVEKYLFEHYPGMNIKSSFFEEAIRSYISGNHTHKNIHIKEPRSRTEKIVSAMGKDSYDKEIAPEQLREVIRANVGEDERTIEKYMGKWAQTRIQNPEDHGKVTIRYQRYVPRREKRKIPTGLLFEIGFLKESSNPDIVGMSLFQIDWRAVDSSLWPKYIKERLGNES